MKKLTIYYMTMRRLTDEREFCDKAVTLEEIYKVIKLLKLIITFSAVIY